jgi:hypothetical protein
LEHCGFNRAQFRDGRVLVFEINASMRLNYDHVAQFPYLWTYLDTVGSAFQTFVVG